MIESPLPLTRHPQPRDAAARRRDLRARPGWFARLRLIGASVLLLTGASRAAAYKYAPAAPGVSFDQRIGQSVPLDTVFRDETGRTVHLRQFFGAHPVVMIFGYSRCPQLCSIISSGAVTTLRNIRRPASQYSLVWISIDPTDTPLDLASLKRRDLRHYDRPGADRTWHYLAGDVKDVRAVADAVGFHYTHDPRTNLFAHASGLVVLTPHGRISQYFFGVDFPAKGVADALNRAADGDTGQSVFQLLLVCAQGIGLTGRYGKLIWACLQVAVVLTVVVLFGGIGWMVWQERRRRAAVKETVP